MAIAVSDRLPAGSKFRATRAEISLVEQHVIEGDTTADNAQYPFVAQGVAGVPQWNDPHPDYAVAKVIDRKFANFSPKSCIGTFIYSDNTSANLVLDGDSVTTYDMSGRTEIQPWDLNTISTIENVHAAIGPNNEGAQVYRPSLSITDETLQSSVDSTIYELTGKINDAVFKGFGIQTLLFVGAVARSEGSSWRVTYTFLYDPNHHLVLWRNYRDDPVPEEGKNVIKRVYSGVVHDARVYELGSFNLLPF